MTVNFEKEDIDSNEFSNASKTSYQLQFLRSLKEVLAACKNEELSNSETVYNGLIRKKIKNK